MERKNKSASSPAGEKNTMCACVQKVSPSKFLIVGVGSHSPPQGAPRKDRGHPAATRVAGSYTRVDPAPTRVNVVFHP